MAKLLQSVGTVGLFGLYDASQHCFKVVELAFRGCHGCTEFMSRFSQMSELEQAGVYLYVGLGSLSLLGLVGALIGLLGFHLTHARQTLHQHLHKKISAVSKPPEAKTKNSA